LSGWGCDDALWNACQRRSTQRSVSDLPGLAKPLRALPQALLTRCLYISGYLRTSSGLGTSILCNRRRDDWGRLRFGIEGTDSQAEEGPEDDGAAKPGEVDAPIRPRHLCPIASEPRDRGAAKRDAKTYGHADARLALRATARQSEAGDKGERDRCCAHPCQRLHEVDAAGGWFTWSSLDGIEHAAVAELADHQLSRAEGGAGCVLIVAEALAGGGCPVSARFGNNCSRCQVIARPRGVILGGWCVVESTTTRVAEIRISSRCRSP